MTRKFLVVADDSAEFRAALSYAAQRARSTGGRVSLLKVLAPSTNDYFAGVREEIEAEMRKEGEALLVRLGADAEARSGAKPEFLIEVGETREALKRVVAADPEIKILVLAAAVGGRGPGPLVTALAKEGSGFWGRKLPVTVVPGDLSDEEIEALA
ncbi:MAG: universal stress protein [Caulobacterales bacterium]|nr:universal stress protein [Caulobacterales bacterium]